jgi:hypothetical protein
MKSSEKEKLVKQLFGNKQRNLRTDGEVGEEKSVLWIYGNTYVIFVSSGLAYQVL